MFWNSSKKQLKLSDECQKNVNRDGKQLEIYLIPQNVDAQE